MRWKIESQEKKLDELFELVRTVSDEETQSHLSKLLCIRASGLLEVAFKNLILDYLHGTSPKEIQSYVNKGIKNLSNLRHDKLINALSGFSKSWVEQFENEVTDELVSSLNSLISNRNNIAHGENDNITFRSVEKYYEDTKSIIEILKKIIKKSGNRN